MNKLAPIALALLLFFGGALWYLANSQLNADVKTRIILVAQYYTDQVVTIDDVIINHAEGKGNIYGLTLNNSNRYKNKIAITIEKLSFTFDKKSLNNNIILVDEILISNGQFFIEKEDEQQTNFTNLLLKTDQKIALIQDARKQKVEPFISASRVNIINAQAIIISSDLTRIEDSNPTITIDNMTLNPIGGENGLPASLFGIEVLRKTIEAVTMTAIN